MGKKMLIKELHEETGLSEWNIRQRAKSGRIPAIKSGNRWIFDIDLVNEYLKNEAMSNIRPTEPVKPYGALRKVNCNQ